MRKATAKKNITAGTTRVLTLLLLFLYVAGTSHLESIHRFVHHHPVVVSHTPQEEEDPCHRLLYHDDAEQGCDHESHLISSDECQMCDIASPGTQTVLCKTTFATKSFSADHFDFYKLNIDSYQAVLSSSRAPPTFV